MTDRIYCSQEALAAKANPAGTAVQVDQWLLIEYPRPWRPKALIDNDFPEAVNDNLARLPEDAAAAGCRLRVQFIKQASSADVTEPRIFFADGRDGAVRLTGGVLTRYGDIAQLRYAELAQHNLPSAHTVSEEFYLVCTNGQRDVCCARFGLPLFESLRQEYGHRIWQTTHLGGHRFAPNLLCLPSGFVYGFVDPDQGCDLVNKHDQGAVAVGQLRGRSCYSPAMQAAECYVRQQHGLADIAALTISSEEIVKQDTSHVHYRVHSANAPASVTVHRVEQPQMVLASCGAALKPDFEFQISNFEQMNK